MKKLLPLILFAFLANNFSAQTASSITNGSWTNPTTWNCTCVPVNGYSVTINNSVTLNTSLLFNSGGININNTGSLTQDASLNRDIWINGGYFNNSGKANFRYFLLSTGAITNPGSFTVSALTNSVSFNNTGSIKMDSMWIAGTFTNAATGIIIGDSLTINNSLLNNGRMTITAITNSNTVNNNNYIGGYELTNSGTFNNSDSVILTGSIWNRVKFNNNSGAKVRITKRFFNTHPSKTAVWDNNGNVTVLDSWYNTDTIKGGAAGYFSVADTSANSGFLKGNFTFCDLTPPVTPIKIDLNSGTVAGTILYCVTGIKENELAEVKVYPNPSNGNLFCNSSGNVNLKFTVLDITGKIAFEQRPGYQSGTSEVKLDLANGIYFLKIVDLQTGDSKTEKLIIQK